MADVPAPEDPAKDDVPMPDVPAPDVPAPVVPVATIPKITVPKLNQPSPFFLHYGPHNYSQFKGTNRSGITPMSPILLEGPYLSAADYEIRKYIEKLQMSGMNGFTTRELKVMETMPIYVTTSPAPTLANEIHPILQLDHWEAVKDMPKHLPPLPIGHGYEGFWAAENPVVWEAIQPGLHLATALLDNIHLWPWWDALLNAKPEEITDKLANNGSKLYRIRLRPQTEWSGQNRAQTRRKFSELAQKMTWTFGTGEGDAWIRNSSRSNIWYGMATFNRFFVDRIRLHLGCEMVFPLLRTDLTQAERRLQDFHLAATLVHELCHGLWKAISHIHPKMFGEPYFEDEPISELGLSMQAYMFGGTPAPLFKRRSPTVAMGLVSYPTIRDWFPLYPLLYMTPQMAQYCFYPVPVSYFVSLQQDSFWKCYVEVFGGYSTQFNPLSHGRSISDRYEPGWVQYHLAKDYPHDLLVVNAFASDDNSVGFRNENDRRQQALRVQKALTGNRILEIREAMRRGVLETFQPFNEDTRQSEDDDDDERDLDEPARFEEIRDFLFEHRQRLALDTMIERRPLDLVLAYVNRTNLITISDKEWKDFVLYCSSRAELFDYHKSDRGEMECLNDGWPSVQWVTPPTPDVPEAHQKMMIEHMNRHMIDEYRTMLPDMDKEWVRRFFNFECKAELSVEEFDDLLAWCNYKKRYWVTAPEGMARLRSEFETDYEHLPEEF